MSSGLCHACPNQAPGVYQVCCSLTTSTPRRTRMTLSAAGGASVCCWSACSPSTTSWGSTAATCSELQQCSEGRCNVARPLQQQQQQQSRSPVMTYWDALGVMTCSELPALCWNRDMCVGSASQVGVDCSSSTLAPAAARQICDPTWRLRYVLPHTPPLVPRPPPPFRQEPRRSRHWRPAARGAGQALQPGAHTGDEGCVRACVRACVCACVG